VREYGYDVEGVQERPVARVGLERLAPRSPEFAAVLALAKRERAIVGFLPDVVGHEIGYRLWPFIVQLFDLRLAGTATDLRWIRRTSYIAAV
jgi:hypothetical protein